jgi:hypothetical protein
MKPYEYPFDVSFFDSVRWPDRGLDSSSVLEQPTSILLGVSQAAAKALDDVGIATVFDLASSIVFANAVDICLLAESGQGRFAATGKVPHDALRDDYDKPLTELPFQPINILSTASPTTKLDALADAIDVASIRDLAAWPPYRTARELLNRVYNPMASCGLTDPQAPADLVPANGQYPTERVQYEVLLFDHFVGGKGRKTSQRELGDDGALSIPEYLSDQHGYERPAIGGVLTFTQSWYTKGLSLGHLIHGVALGPGESTKIAMIDWSRKVLTSATEDIQESERLLSDLSHARSIGEITSAVARETQQGKSAAHSEATSTERGESSGSASFRDLNFASLLTGITSPGVTTSGTSFGTSSGSTDATAWSTSSGQREVGASLAQDIVDRTHQASHLARNRRASIVREVSQKESESISTRTLTNYNHMHALTVEYYEVVQLYRTVVELSKADRCLFVPMRLIDFRDLKVIDRYRTELANAALSPVVREALELPATTTRIKAPAISTSELYVAGSSSSPVEKLSQDRWIAQDMYAAQIATAAQIRVMADGRLALPSDAVLSSIDFIVRESTPSADDPNASAAKFFVGKTIVTVNGTDEAKPGPKIQKGSRVRVAAAGLITFSSGTSGTEADFFSGSTEDPIVVDAKEAKETGLRIQKGSRVNVKAAGRVWYDPHDVGWGYDADANKNDLADTSFYARGLAKYSLVCRIGTKWYQGGTDTNFVTTEDGKLVLVANDAAGELDNNRGSWSVTITVTPPAGTTTQTSFDADGKAQVAGTKFYARGLRECSLVCRVGTKWHQGGTDKEFVAGEDGDLLLQPNDEVGGLADNSGSWQVTLEVSAPSEGPQTISSPKLTISKRDGTSITITRGPSNWSFGNNRVRVDEINAVAISVPNVTAGQFGFLAAVFQYQSSDFRIVFPVRLDTSAAATVFYIAVPTDLVSHFVDHQLYYSQVVWRALNPATIGILLSDYTWLIAGKPRPLVEIVDPNPVAVVANYLVLRISGDEEEEHAGWLTKNKIKVGSRREDQIPIPSGGVFAEAVLGRFNSAERLDISRFWDWQESPIPIQAPEIAAIQAGSRRDEDNTVPGQLGAPLLNIVNPPALPNPQGMGAVLAAVQNGNMFRDMSGLAATIGLAQAGLAGAFQGASDASTQAGKNAAVAAELGAKVAEIVGKIVGAYLSGGASMGGGIGGGGGSSLINSERGNSKAGSVLNYARDMDTRGVPHPNESTTTATDQPNPEGGGDGATSNADSATSSAADTWEGDTMKAAAGVGGDPFTVASTIAKMFLTAGPDAGTAAATGSGVIYWARPDQPREVMIDPPEKPGDADLGFFTFDFTPTGDGTTGTIKGKRTAWRHKGGYTLKTNRPGSFEMDVHIGDDANQKNDLNVTLTIENGKAKVTGTYGEGTPKEKKTPAKGDIGTVTGVGSAASPFSVKFPASELRWP